MKKYGLILMFIAAVITARAQWPGPHSRIESDSIRSEILKDYRTFTVYLPAGFDDDKGSTYPVLYLLHGIMGTDKGWFNDQRAGEVMDQLVASGEACPMIIVSPNAGGNIFEGAWNGYFNMPGWNYEDFFFTEFVPYIEKKYRCGGSKGRRAIAGLSMGGGGTTVYAQHHPDMFCAAYPISALMDIPAVGAMGGQQPEGKMALLNKSVTENSCINLMPTTTPKKLSKASNGMWTAATTTFCSTAISNSCKRCDAPAFLCNSVYAMVVIQTNTGTQPCLLPFHLFHAVSTINEPKETYM